MDRDYFSSRTYDQSRETFRGLLATIRGRWPGAVLTAHRVDDDEDLTIDVIEAPAEGGESGPGRQRIVILTCGQHGVEAFVGAAMLRLFTAEFLDRLDPRTTGLILVHAINPWGMRHFRRVDRDNVDLNRNFVWDWGATRGANPDYRRIAGLLAPEGKIDSALSERVRFYAGVTRATVSGQIEAFKRATLLGQYEFPRGLYYGGTAPSPSTTVMTSLYRRTMERYAQVLHLDMHTGYGPADLMNVVGSAHEPRGSIELQQAFAYPRVVAATPGEFYGILGDMIDYVYLLARRDFPRLRLYAASFEFGTVGDSLLSGLESLRRMVAENRACWNGARRGADAENIQQDFVALFAPSSRRWREAALANARQAFAGILRAEGFITG
ncbi:MAG TPA: M14 family metallopeptidase [Bacillota bacterium]|jgi:hypothetical protein